MAEPKREVVERTEDWATLRRHLKWPEQLLYELVRPVVIFGETAGERARATGEHARTIDRQADRFDRAAMRGLLPTHLPPAAEDPRSLPPPMRQLIVNLRAEAPTMALREIALICEVQVGRRPSHHSVQKVLAARPAPSVTTRRFPPYSQISDPVQRRPRVARRERSSTG